MDTNTHEMQVVKQASGAGRFIAGVIVGGLAGAVAALLTAPQAGSKTRAELQQGVGQLRERTSETVKDTVTEVRTKANQIKTDVQIKAGELQHQGKKLLVKQLDRVTQMADAGKKAIEDTGEHIVA